MFSYPQEITEHEKEQGFRLMNLPGLDDDDIETGSNPRAVVLIISPSDVKVKEYVLGGVTCKEHGKEPIVYRKFRWGKNVTIGTEHPSWWPMDGQPDKIVGEPFLQS